jgi:hypothetical protein
MKKNMNKTDRIVRILIAIVLATLYFTGVIPGVLGVVLTAIATVFTITSFISFCPIYALLGVSTCKIKEK